MKKRSEVQTSAAIDIVVDNRVRVATIGLPSETVDRLKQNFEHDNPAWWKLRRLGFPTYSEKKTIATWAGPKYAEEPDVLSFPSGGLDRVLNILRDDAIQTRIVDERCTGAILRERDWLKHSFQTQRTYQEEMIQAALKHQTCILRAPTGSGKTSVALAIAAAVKVPTLVMVTTQALMKQWITRAEKELGISRKDIGIIHGNKRDLKPITVAMQKTVASRGVDAEMNAYFGALVFDEVQLAAARTVFDAIDPWRAKYRIGISADHRRKDGKDFLITDLFGDVVYEVSRKELVKRGSIMNVEIRVVPTDFEAPWYGINEPPDPSTRSDLGERWADAPEKEINWDRLLREITENDERNGLVLWCADQELRAGNQVIVMSHRREHCKHLDMIFTRRGERTGFLIGGEDRAKEFDITRAGFEKGDVRIAVGTFQAIGFGIDLPAAGVVVCSTPIAGNEQFFNQVRGRACRIAPGKTRAVLYYLWDRAVYPKHLANLVRWNETVTVYESGRWVDARDKKRRHNKM